MSATLVFGWRTAVLALSSAQMLLIALALARTLRNRSANRSLAALLLVLTGLLTPYTIGFAGFYDAFPWLSFAPFAVPLAVGPLLYFYTHAMALGTLPPRAGLHLAPAAVQFAYQGGSFLLPLAAKARWDALSTPFVEPLVAAGVVAGLAGYSLASLKLLRTYRALLAQQRSDDHRFAARWLSRAVAALLVLLAAWTAYQAWERLVAPLDYFGELGLYLIVAAIGGYLAVEGWRHADLVFPRPAQPPPPAGPGDPETGLPAASGETTAAAAAAARDWCAIGERWAGEVRAGQWHRDPELSLPALARLLGTNTTHLSRALNEGLGMNFSTFIATLRCETVANALRAGAADDLLTLALDAGFGSKATFNRAFQAIRGQSPSAYRRAHGSSPTS
jgi:AraC-like DNA-binding protein